MHWLASNYQWLVVVVVMPILLLLLKEWADSRKKASTPTPAPQTALDAQHSQVTNSPVAAGSGINQNINAPVINVNMGQPAAVQARAEPEHAAISRDDKPQESEKEEAPKVDFIQPRYVLIYVGRNVTWSKSALSTQVSARPAVVAEFKNKPKPVGQRTVEASSVTASLVYRGKGNPEELHVSHGTWLNEYTHFASFPCAKTHDLVVAVKPVPAVPQIWTPFVVLENRRAIDDRSRFTPCQAIQLAQQVNLPASEGELEITLVDGWGVTVYHGLFDYDFSSADTVSFKAKFGARRGPGFAIRLKQRPGSAV